MTVLPAGDQSETSAETMRHALARCQSDLDSLRRREAAWHTIFLSAPVALSLISASDGRLRAVNARYAQLVGLTAEALHGRLSSEFHLLPENSDREQIAVELSTHASVEQIAGRYQRPDGTMQASLSSLRLVEMGGETLILSSTVEVPDASAGPHESIDAQNRRVAELEAELAAHREQEARLLGEISGLCTEASLLKSDIIRLKQMQQQVSSEMENLRKHAVLAANAAAVAAPPSEAISSSAIPPHAQSASGAAAVKAQAFSPAQSSDLGGAGDALWDVASARLQHVEEQLIRHVAALREQAGRMQAGSASA